MNTPPGPGFAEYPRPQVTLSGVTPRDPGVHFDAINEASRLFGKEWLTWVGAGLVCLLLYIVGFAPFVLLNLYVQYGTLDIANLAGRHPSTGSQLESIVILLPPSWIAAGLQGGFGHLALRQIHGQPIAVGQIFGGFRYAGRLMAMNLMVSLPISLIGILIGPVGSMLTVIPLSIAYVLFALAPFIVLDQNAGALDAMRRGFATLKGNRFRMFWLFVVMGFLYLFGAILCLIGEFAAIPIVTLTFALQYFYFFPEQFQPAPPLRPAAEGGGL